MHAVFWSPVTGQTGTTSSLAAIALTGSYRCKKKVLLTQTHFGNQELEEIILGGKQGEEIYQNIGLDALLRLVRTNNLTDGIDVTQIMKDYIISLGKVGLDLLCGTRKEFRTVLEEEMVMYLPFLYHRLDDDYDLILTDTAFGKNRLSQSLWNEADLLVVTLNQNISVIRNTLMEYQFPLEKTIFILGNYQKNSVYNKRNLEKQYKELRGRLYDVPSLVAFMDSISNRELISFYLKNMTLRSEGEREEFFQAVFKVTEVLIKEKSMGGNTYVT